MSKSNYGLVDVLEKVNAFRAKMLNRGIPVSVTLPENTIEELSCHVERNENATLSLGSQGFEDPRVNELVESVSKSIVEGCFDSDGKFQEKTTQEATSDLIRKFHEDTVREIIENDFAQVEHKALNQFKEHAKKRWEDEKARFIEGIELAKNRFSFKPSAFNDHLVDTYPLMLSRSTALSEDEVHFARLVHEYVDDKVGVKQQPRDKLKNFFIRNYSNSGSDGIWELWRLIEFILFESDENNDNWTNKLLVKAFLNFLQTEYREFLRKQVSTNLANAELGGIPGIYSLVRGYLATCSPSKFSKISFDKCLLIEGKPAWQFVYLCLRCGDRKAALRASVLANLPVVWIQLLEGIDISLEQLRCLYNSPNVTDSYQRACFCLMDSECDPTNSHSDVVDSIEDFLWLRLSQVYFTSVYSTDSNFNDKFTSLQTQIRDEFGEKYFVNSSENTSDSIPCPLLYCQCLLLTGQFENAIELLCRYPKDSLFVHAVHMAIVLFESKLLGVSESCDNPLLANDEINLYKILKTYAEKRFLSSEGHDELLALLDYLFLLEPIQCTVGKHNDQVVNGFLKALTSLKLDENQIAKIYGISAAFEFAYRRPHSLIDNYLQNSNQALMHFADVLDSEAGNCTTLMSAMLRFHAGNFERAADNICELLALGGFLCIQSSIEHNSKSSEIFKFAEHLVNVLGDKHPKSQATYEIANFFLLFNNRKYREALDLLRRQAKIIPFSFSDVDDCICQFISLPEQLKHAISDIIESTAVCLQKVYKCDDNYSSSIDPDEIFNQSYAQMSSKYLREQTDALIRYSESVPFHVRSNVSKRLLQLCTSCSA
ncbi:hypothetical protein GJ496_006222 [Pomphorhynchus laevis]|nr:hypothetical protein GJ496_006222 [Pomphorhynchus laevis]